MSPLDSVKRNNTAAFFDLDNTLISGTSIYYFVRGLVKHGEITRRSIAKLAYHHLRFLQSKTETESAIETTTKKLLDLTAGKACANLHDLCLRIVEEFLPKKLNSNLLAEVNRHKTEGRDTYIITASPKEIAQIVSTKLGMTEGFGTNVEIIEERYSGRLISKPLHGFSKAEKITELAIAKNYDLDNSFAYSDSINDLPMLALVGYPNIVNPNKELETLAKKNRWPILNSA